MQKYQNDIVIAHSSSPNGPMVPAVGATVTVYVFGTPTLAIIYSDNGVTQKTNPTTTDSNGSFNFYAADGRYSLEITGTDITTRNVIDILLEDPQDGSPATYSTLTVTGQASLGGSAGSESLRITQAPSSAVNRVQVVGAITAGEPLTGVEGSDTNINYGIYSKGTGSVRFLTGGGALEQFRVTHTASAVNFIGLTGAIATASPTFTATGSDTNIGVNYNAKGTGIHTFNTGITITLGSMTVTNGNLTLNTAGNGLRVKEGTNGMQGVATLVAGTVTVNTTNVTANSRIFLCCQTPGGTPGFLRISARVAATSFTILSSSGTDTSVVAYQIFEPA